MIWHTIITLFREQVSKNGAKTAVAEPDGRRITYSGLDENARRVAAKLLSDGLKTSEPVLIAASRGIGFVEAIFGILYAGGAYVPLSDHYPEDRTEFIKNNCGARSVIDDTFIAACADIAPIEKPTEVRPEDNALIIYTSGSTGKPKGIIHSHSSLKSSTERIVKAAAMVDSDICAVNAPFYFVAHIADMLTPLCVGMTAYILPDEVRADPVRLAEIIDSESVTVAYIAPKVLRYFEKKGSSLRIVLSAGERMSQIAPEGFRLLNMYGMSETAGIAACFEVNRGYDNTPIGKPADGVDIYLLDEDGNDGYEGEICVSGDMGRGYIGLPEQTAQTFTPNPFREKDCHDILIHTGDLGKRLPDGISST
ncbi:MAG: AMP-binding protein [Ruminiclostridium sp.]|nr:AMP-binding protein [Ruminiclostridium sp.]